MPEDNLASETLPEIPAQTTSQKNEHDPAGIIDPQTTLFQKVRAAGASVVEAAGIPFRKGRGRPRKDGQPGKLDKPNAMQQNASSEAARPLGGQTAGQAGDGGGGMDFTASNPASDALFRRSVASAVKGIFGFFKSLIKSKAARAGLDAGFTERALRECEPEPEVLSDFSESLETVLKKYNVKTEYSPEIALAVSTARMAAPYWMLFGLLNDEITRKKSPEIERHLPGLESELNRVGLQPDQIMMIKERLRGKK